MITTQDRELSAEKGIIGGQVVEQLVCFWTGFPFLKLDVAASTEKGISTPGAEEQRTYLAAWDAYTSTDKAVVKFVSASGAASRMLKNLFEFPSADYDRPTTKFGQTFFDGIKNFAFYDDLSVACQHIDGKDIPGLIEDGDHKAVVSALLKTIGLNYGVLPKGLLKFHKYPEGSRIPMKEHLAEGALYAAGKSGKVSVHFTISTGHRGLFKKLIGERVGEFSKRYRVDYYITFSEQRPNTDTIVASMDSQPFRDNGKSLFRPGGHDVLIENLNDLDADVIFVKNIDNIMPDGLKADTVICKRLIAEVFVALQKQVFEYLTLLDSGKYTHDQMMETLQFSQKKLFCKNPETRDLEDSVLATYLGNKFNHPMHVCGMVKNVGESSGGPFLAYNSDGTISLQILESPQINMDSPEKKEIFEKGTHFNPVDPVCAVCDYKRHKFDLVEYVDKATGFILHKSESSKGLKTLELPGLWNRAISGWNTVFVEVPLSTFNSVKTVNDLLREQHQ